MMKSLSMMLLLFFGLAGTWAQAQNTECEGTSTAASEGTFTEGYNYSFTTEGTDVTVNFQLLDEQVGLIAYAQTLNPDFVESAPQNPGPDQTFSWTFPDQADGATFTIACKFAYAGGLSTTQFLMYTVGDECEGDVGSNECEGTSTAASEGTFTEGYNYAFTTEGTDVTVDFQLLDEQVGLVGFAQTMNPDFAETPPQNPGPDQTFSWTFPDQADGATFTVACKFAYAGGLATTEFLTYTVGNDCEGGGGDDGITLPVTFDDEATNYELQDFGGNTSMIVVDPTDAGNMVVESTKADNAELWAGTTVADLTGFESPIPFEAGATTMSVRIWSPAAGTPILLKVEQVGVPSVSVETITNSTLAGEWETLVFDFANEREGTAPINFASIYNKASIFYNYGTSGADAGEAFTFYWDDLTFASDPVDDDAITLPVTFDDEAINYELQDFGGNTSMIVVDPTDAGNMVVESTKADNAELWAGTTVADLTGFESPIPFEAGATTMTVRVWSPAAGTPILLKVEQVGVPSVSVETITNSTLAGEWETLVFDFANEREGTAPINFASIYNKASIFYNYGTSGADAGEAFTFYWDDLTFASDPVDDDAITLPITFESTTVDYEIQDFGGNASQIVVDPTDAGNMVVESTKADNAELWAGTTVADLTGFESPIPFEAGATTMTVRVWSPAAGTPILLKVEQVGVPSVSVETITNSTLAGEWETLVFDFANEREGTAPINFASIYNKASIFYNYGTSGADAGEAFTFYWDDLTFASDPVDDDAITLPITFESTTVDYEIQDFGGNASQIVVDPTDAGNMVVETIRTAGALDFAGTTVGDVTGFESPIPFADGETTMSVRVWSPAAGTPILMKVEQVGVPSVSAEWLLMSTVAGDWETLVYDLANDPTFDVAATYNKLSMFFNFGLAGAADATTYYWDDVSFGGVAIVPDPITLPVTFEDAELDYQIADFGGNATQIVVDPTDATNMVAQSIRTAGSLPFAGTTVADVTGFESPIPFADGATTMSVRVWSPNADIPVLLKVENAADAGTFVQVLVNTTMAGEWETLEYDFSTASGPALDFGAIYNKATIFFDFEPASNDVEQTYYWDDLAFGGDAPFTVVNVILDNPDLSTLAFALEEAELIDALNGAGPFTVFAPTNQAFDDLPDGVLDDLLADPTGDLQQILLYHVLGIEVLAADIVDGPQTTLQGEDVELLVDGADVTVNQADVVDPDNEADNGVVHVINAVLLPPSFVDGLEEISSNDNISVYPNPASDMINVEVLLGDIAGSTITMYDLTGKVVLQSNIVSQMTRLNTSMLNAGHYILRLDTPTGGFYQNVVLTK